MNSNRQLHLWPWFILGCIVSIANPLLGALVLFPVCVLWIAKKMNDG